MSTPISTLSLRNQVIEAALPDILFDGWSLQTIEAAAAKEGIEPSAVKAAFPHGLTDILDSFANYADDQMMEALSDTSPDDLRIRDRIKTALVARFTYLNDHKEITKDTLKFWLNPLRKPRAAKIVWRTADRIWDWAGDTATDYNRYTKRSLLCGIIASATIAWLNDDTADMSKTKRFIEDRINNVMMIEKIKAKLTK